MHSTSSLSDRPTYRGAPFGLQGDGALDVTAGKCGLRRVPLNSGGYDAIGNYWGRGIPLFQVEGQAGEVFVLRARDRDAAKARLIEIMPGITFKR